MRVGIDLGGTNIAVGLVNEEGQIVLKKSAPTGAERPWQEVVNDMAKLVLDLVKEAGLEVSDIEQIGIGSPGTPQKDTGMILFSNNLFWHNVPLRDAMEKLIPVPVKIDNDANVAALGETLFGAAKGAKDAILVTLGTGVGGGIILDGKVYDGINNAGAEVGHMVIMSGGEPCNCGRLGCWEVYASATALIRMGNAAAAAHPESILAQKRKKRGGLNGLAVFKAADENDPVAIEVIDRYIFYVSEGIINLVNIFQPEVVMLGGGISAQGERLLRPIRQHLMRYVYCKEVNGPKLACAALGNDAGIIGAAFL